MNSSWTSRVTQSVASAAGAFVPTAARHGGPFGMHNDEDEDDVDAKLSEKARALREQQTTTSTVEQHYFHMHEVWHCLYNRTETNHLRDPDNDEFKNEEARKRQISLFESLMQTSQVELYQSVNADIDNECCARLQVCTQLNAPRPVLLSIMRVSHSLLGGRCGARSRWRSHPLEAST